MSHLLEALIVAPMLYCLARFASHEMYQRAALTEEAKAARQEDEAW